MPLTRRHHSKEHRTSRPIHLAPFLVPYQRGTELAGKWLTSRMRHRTAQGTTFGLHTACIRIRLWPSLRVLRKSAKNTVKGKIAIKRFVVCVTQISINTECQFHTRYRTFRWWKSDPSLRMKFRKPPVKFVARQEAADKPGSGGSQGPQRPGGQGEQTHRGKRGEKNGAEGPRHNARGGPLAAQQPAKKAQRRTECYRSRRNRDAGLTGAEHVRRGSGHPGSGQRPRIRYQAEPGRSRRAWSSQPRCGPR
jgi:hypothetical protein